MPAELRFDRNLDFEYGVLQTVAPYVRRVVARNPSPFTFHGTGTYVVGHGRVAVIDPGPALVEHIEALVEALRGETVTHVLVTHTHLDHSPGCALLRRFSSAPTYGYGPHGSGWPAAGDRTATVEEGADFEFAPDVEVRDGDVIECDGFSFECVHTPGHTSNHVCYRLREERALFCGDHVMGWSTTIVSPPDGHMGTYIASLERLLDGDDRTCWPTHGAPIRDPKPHVESLIAHRRRRVREVEVVPARRDRHHPGDGCTALPRPAGEDASGRGAFGALHDDPADRAGGRGTRRRGIRGRSAGRALHPCPATVRTGITDSRRSGRPAAPSSLHSKARTALCAIAGDVKARGFLGPRAGRPLENRWACGPLAGGTPAVPGNEPPSRSCLAGTGYSLSTGSATPGAGPGRRTPAVSREAQGRDPGRRRRTGP